ncbi:hypothetical protein SEVCU121_0117 [Staphylococcus warneri VCU121]|nr:hypothetical protein SEVCU121_0117 [Staphylococcus warneri VCU121]KEK47727.1 hypothetical protein AQ02_1509 [Staphylococcus warneri Lyso 1 2011]KEK53392.1 hypothetical protein AQ03_1479 [Staphylococcus warneri Lyso 2 2011]KKI61932.1 hypothetical protein UF68_1034 [Staphylococcus warneri]
MLKRLQDNNSIISNFVKVDLPIIVKKQNQEKFGSALI